MRQWKASFPSRMQAGKQAPHIAHMKPSNTNIPSRLADQSVDVLKHITLRGGVWPNACAASIRDLSRHLNKPSKKLNKSPEADPGRLQLPSARFATTSHNLATEPIDGLSTLAGAAEVHATFDSQNHPRALAYTQAYNNQSQGEANAPAYMPTPNSAFATQASDEAFTANVGSGFPPTATQPSHGGYNPDFPSAPFFGQGSQPAASWPSDSLFDLNNVELFAGFDIPFWLDDEQYVPFLDNQ
jgi:hypothetical protein